MKKNIARLILFFTSWKVKVDVDRTKLSKSVMIAAPHTSNWDLFFSVTAFWYMEVPVKFFIKSDHIEVWYGGIVKWLGGIPVDRSKKNQLVDYACTCLKQTDKLIVMIPAEGTRKRVKAWRKGFYHIASLADVPIALGYLDYAKKVAGIGQLVYTSDDFEKDMTRIENFYKDKIAKYPENYNLQIFVRKDESTR